MANVKRSAALAGDMRSFHYAKFSTNVRNNFHSFHKVIKKPQIKKLNKLKVIETQSYNVREFERL